MKQRSENNLFILSNLQIILTLFIMVHLRFVFISHQVKFIISVFRVNIQKRIIDLLDLNLVMS